MQCVRMRPPTPLPLHGAFTTRKALDSGITPGRLRGRDVSHPFRGVNSTTAGLRDLHARCQALQLKLPEHVFFSGPTAIALLGGPLPARFRTDDRVHVAVPAGRRTLVGRGIIGHTYERSDSVRDRHSGLRTSTPERAWVELAAVLTLGELVAVGDYLIHWRAPFTTLERLGVEVARYPGRRGRSKLLRALALLDARSESAQESRLRLVAVETGISGWQPNWPIRTSDGYRYRGDLVLPMRRFILEYQSDEFHNTSTAFRADMTRVSRLAADRWITMFVNANDLGEPRELARRIIRAVADRPRFPV